MNLKKLELIFELLIFGIILGITEDLIAIKLATGASIDLRIIVVVVLVTIPFAIIGELIIDRIDFIEIFRKVFGKKDRENMGQSSL